LLNAKNSLDFTFRHLSNFVYILHYYWRCWPKRLHSPIIEFWWWQTK